MRKMREWQSVVLRGVALGLVAVMLSGCASYWSARRADKLIAQGRTDEGVNLLHKLSDRNPDDYQLRFVDARDRATAEYMQKAREARMRGDSDGALAAYGAVLRYDPQNVDAAQGITLIARDRREATQLAQARAALDKGDAAGARAALREVLVENPDQADARAMLQQMDLATNRVALAEPALRSSLKKPVSLEFRNASIQSVFEVLSQSSGVNFIFDKDVKPDVKTTIFARNTTVEDALNLILRTNQLNRKVLNDSTLLIYPATADKDKQYAALVPRTFYLGNADAKKVQEMLRTLVAPKAM
jgi:general secretion pathway protein D